MATPPPRRPIDEESIPGAPSWLDKLLQPINAFIRPTAEALDRGLTFRENFAGEVKTITVTPPEDWVFPAFGTGWVAVTAGVSPRRLSYRKLLDGTVQLRGRVDFPTGTPTSPSTIITFPDAGWTPNEREVFDAFASDGVNYAPATVAAFNGVFAWQFGGHRNLSLSGDVWWVASDRTPPRWARPVDFRLGTPDKPFPGRPGYVQVLGAYPTNAPTAPALVTALDWTPTQLEERGAQSQAVRIHRVWGLSPGVSYTLTLLVLPE